ncbi:hypothetical protein GGX14DRAFT_381066, partial [Mycena pura]
MDPNEIWAANRLVSGPASDGGRARVPTLSTRNAATRIVSNATTNEEKSAAFHKEFFPPKLNNSSVPQDPVYPEPAYEWRPISDDLLHRVIAKMKPYKATRAGSFPNSVFIFNAHLLVPFYGAIYRALDALRYYPEGWNHVDSLVLRKPGKTNYADPAAYRPICLTVGDARIYHAVKTAQLATQAELARILPKNHYG